MNGRTPAISLDEACELQGKLIEARREVAQKERVLRHYEDVMAEYATKIRRLENKVMVLERAGAARANEDMTI